MRSSQKAAAEHCRPEGRSSPRDINEILRESEERVRRFLQDREEAKRAGAARLKKRVANPNAR